MKLKEALQKYLEEMAAQDDVLRSKYNPEKMDECRKYVNTEAKKYLNNCSGAVEDSIVYKWARDYFIEVMQEEKKMPETQNVQAQDDDESAEPQEEEMEQIEESEELAPLMENAKPVQKMSKKEEKEKEYGQLFFDF